MEAVTHHALSKETKGDCQDNKKQELSNSEPERFLLFRGFVIRTLCHLSCLSAKSSDCRNAIHALGPAQ
jgi:hypothetical protein